MNKRIIGGYLAVAAAISLAAVISVHAADDTVATNDNANINAVVNDNSNVPPTPMLYSDLNVNAPDQAPPQNNPTDDMTPPDQINPPANPPTTVAPPTTTGTNGNVPPAAGKRVKIQHPDLIKFFQDIKKVGDSLFGILKNSAGGAAGTMPGSDNSSIAPKTGTVTGGGDQSAPQQLEKILTPDMIKLFTSIKKVGTSLFGVRKGGAKAYRVVTADESACVITAIKAKDQSIIDAKTAETAAFTAAVSMRTDCQATALGGTDNQGSAIELCNKAFVTAGGQGQQTFAKAQKDAWTAFTAAAKACAATTSTTNSDIVVPDGSNTLPQPLQPSGL